MEVKEAIEFLRSIKLSMIYYHDQKQKEEQEEKYDKTEGIIALLQQGEAYRQMWGWLDNMVNANGMEYNRVWKVQVGKLMYDLEQKYFPKEVGNNGR